MSNRRTIVWLLLAIVATVAAHFLLDVNSSAPLERAGALLPSADRAEEVVLTRPGERASRIVRTDGAWRLVAPFAAAADDGAVNRLIDALAFGVAANVMTEAELLKIGRVRTDFIPAEPALSVAVVTGTRTNVLAFGTLTPARDEIYAMREGAGSVFVIPTNTSAAIDVPASRLRRQALLNGAKAGVVSFDVRRGAGDYLRFARSTGGWSVTEPRVAPLAEERVDALLESLFAAAATSYVWPVGATNEPAAATVSLLAGYGLDAETSVGVTLRGADGADHALLFGKDAPNGDVYALVQDGAAIATVPAALKASVLGSALATVDTRLWPLDFESVTRISIVDGDTAYLLARDAKAGWRLDAPVAAPADTARADALLRRLLALREEDVAGAGLVVSLATNLAARTLARESVLERDRFEDLRARTVLKVDPATVCRLSQTAEGGTTSIVWDADRRAWNIENSNAGGVADVVAVQALFAALSPLEATSVVKLKMSVTDATAYGLDQPRFTLAIDRSEADAVRRNILVGNETEAGFYATVGASDALFLLSRETVLRLMTPLVTHE